MDLPGRRISSNSPAPPDFGRASFVTDALSALSHGAGSPLQSVPGTPQSLALPMNPPAPTSHSRRSSFGSSPSIRRSVSPAPSLPLPAVMPTANSPSLSGSTGLGLRPDTLRTEGLRNERIYAGEETFSSFFRRLTFSPDGSLLFTPAGQYRVVHGPDAPRQPDQIINTVYVYTRAGLNKPPVAYLPGHKKPSVAVKCSPVFYTLRQAPAAPPRQITIDTASNDDIPALPEPAMASKPTPTTMDPPPVTSAPSPSPSMAAASPKPADSEPTSASGNSNAPPLAFGLPYRIVYAAATSDAVYVYDTQQSKPLVIVSNLHFATFTDLTWSNDGLTLLMTSSDGFCSALSFSPGELGQVYHGAVATKALSTAGPSAINTSVSSQHSTPNATPVATAAPPMTKRPSEQGISSFPASPSTFAPARPASPARSMSVSSVASSFVQPSATGEANVLMHATPSMSTVGGVAAANSGPVPGNVPLWTPPETPLGGGVDANARPAASITGRTHSASSSVSGIGGGIHARRESENEPLASIETPTPAVMPVVVEPRKREAETSAEEEKGAAKKRRVAPTQVGETS